MEAAATKVLVIESDPKEGRLLELALAWEKSPGFTVEWAKTLAEGLEHIREGKPDVILLDLRLQDRSGLAVFQEVHAAASGTPVVLLTGAGDEAVALEAVQKGAQDYVATGVADVPLLSRTLRYAVERKRAEQREEKLKEEFLHNVSHELKTPLTAFKQAVALTLSGIPGPLNEDQKRILDIANRSADHLATMIDDLLDVTRSESGKMTFEPVRMALGDVVRDVLETERVATAKKDIALDGDGAGELPPVYADPVRVKQTLINLIDNAFKFTPPGGRIAVSARLSERHPGAVEVSVSDSGCGIPREALLDVFERLYQVKGRPAETGGRKGLGIGLFICKQIVERQGGRIWVESELGKGSVFTFTLPVFSLEKLLLPVLQRPGELLLLTVRIGPKERRIPGEDTPSVVAETRDVLGHNLYPGDLLMPEIVPGGQLDLVFLAVSIDPKVAPNMIRRLEVALVGAHNLRSKHLHPSIAFDVVPLDRSGSPEQAAAKAARLIEELTAKKVSER
ncbi:MAG TPA: hypothetical protein DCM05_16965 [Elusimicrobia bacterium]|nr:hypothetical protein [Elusimicrobiota bacterium]